MLWFIDTIYLKNLKNHLALMNYLCPNNFFFCMLEGYVRKEESAPGLSIYFPSLKTQGSCFSANVPPDNAISGCLFFHQNQSKAGFLLPPEDIFTECLQYAIFHRDSGDLDLILSGIMMYPGSKGN